ncbi:ankyrin repeat-containing domain protein [Aspergillus californicus]
MYKHPRDDTDCSKCDQSQLVPRGPRESNEPHIHYGLIASGNQVIKDARVRDSFAKRLPVLFIRGICDYCDSYKQKDWQGFASLAAAAYTKASLSIYTEKEKACLEYLCIIDPKDHMNLLKREKWSRTPGTCSWFLELGEFKSWFQQNKGNACLKDGVLWLYGNPGIGKSMMAITLAEELPMKEGLIFQIVNQYPPFMKRVMAKYDVRKEGLFSSFDALWSILMDIGTLTDGPHIYCIIDALDESSCVRFKLHILITSRPYPDIEGCLSVFRSVNLGACEEIKRDLKAMIQDIVKELGRRKKYTESKADGTFLWVGIACNELRLALPRGLHSLYKNLLDATVASTAADSQDDYPFIKKILEFVTFAVRPLMLFTRELVDLCHLLIVVDNGYVRMLHRSVQEFLIAEMKEISLTRSNYALSHRCIDIILQHCRPTMERSTLNPRHGFLAQTGFFVPKEHEQFFLNRLGTWKWWQDSYNYLMKDPWGDLGTNTPAIHVAARWGIKPLISFLVQDELEDEDTYGYTPLLIAARYSQLEAIKLLVESGACLRAVNNDYQNALHLVCKRADFLLKSGVCLYVYDEDNMTPFLYAIGNQHAELAQIFLQNEGAPENLDINLTTLHFSALNTCAKMTAFLLQHGADPNAVSDTGDTALHLAIRGHLLGRKWGDVWGTGDYSIKSLRDLITDYESEEATLLESDITNVNTVNTCGDYPQHVINFHKDYAWHILHKLIEKGADSSQPNGSLQTCLHLSSKAGNFEVVCKLMNEGHDILLVDIDGLTPFHYALYHSHLDILQFMSETRGRELSRVWNSLDDHGRSPLHHVVSSVFCWADVIEFLIQRGCDAGKLDLDRNSSLFLYLKSFHLSIEKNIFFLLVRKGADPLWINKRQESLAHLLMHHREADIEILKFLFDCGLDPAAQDIDGKTLMHHGAIHGVFSKALIEFFRSRDVLDIYSRDSFGKTPLNYAEEKAHLEYLKDVLSCLYEKWEDSFQNLSVVARPLL